MSHAIARQVVRDVVLICPETGEEMIIASKLVERKDGFSEFEVCTVDNKHRYKVSVKLEEL